jgi:hypothetical protein
MKTLILVTITAMCAAVESVTAQPFFPSHAHVYFTDLGTPVPASFHRISSATGELRWQSISNYAYIIQKGDLGSNGWRTWTTAIAHNERTAKTVPLERGSHFFRVYQAPTFDCGTDAYYSLDPYYPQWQMDMCGTEWRWTYEGITNSTYMSGGFYQWKGMHTNVGPQLLTLIITAPDGSSVSTEWAMTVTNGCRAVP